MTSQYLLDQYSFFKILTASFMFMVGVVCFSPHVVAQEKATAAQATTTQKAAAPKATPKKSAQKTVEMATKGQYRYINSFGIPYHLVQSKNIKAVSAKKYQFRVPLKPQKEERPTNFIPGMYFGVALDGTPITHNFASLWDGRDNWASVDKRLDQFGGAKKYDGRYIYAGPPSALMKKSFSHVGYAADGFPIFVSKANNFKPSYQLKSGARAQSGVFPPGRQDGTFLTDYEYVEGLGALDRCNGLLVKDKYYVYVLTENSPRVPLCWSGRPDRTFFKQEKIRLDEQAIARIKNISRTNPSSGLVFSDQQFENYKARLGAR